MSNTRKAKSVDALIASAALPRRTIHVCVRGDLVAEVERLEREISAQHNPLGDTRLTGNAEARKIAEQIESLRAEMQDSTIEFVLQALPRRAFQKFYADHPPRDSNADDKAMGYNTETFHDDLVRASIVEPVLSDEQWGQLADNMTAAQWHEFVTASQTLNMERVSIPFSLSASAALQRSDET